MTTPIQSDNRRFFTPKEVAVMLQVSADTVRRMIRRGQLGCVEISGRTRRVPREAIDRYVREELNRVPQTW